jgi:hypothetical protein
MKDKKKQAREKEKFTIAQNEASGICFFCSVLKRASVLSSGDAHHFLLYFQILN